MMAWACPSCSPHHSLPPPRPATPSAFSSGSYRPQPTPVLRQPRRAVICCCHYARLLCGRHVRFRRATSRVCALLHSDMAGLRINADRLNDTLQTTCSSWGALAAPSTGMCRLTLSPEDKETRDWLVQECKALGCEVKVDQMGNIFAIRSGSAKGRKPIAMGSHMDTQPAGTT